MSKQAFVTFGLAYGDEGKGAAVEYLCREHKPDFVVRYSGGSQAGHNVELPDGRRHTYSQFGAGSHLGIPTYLGPSVIINPGYLQNERRGFMATFGCDPIGRLWIDPNCLVSTPYHVLANQRSELARKDRHGSCGHGIGETRSYWLKYGTDAIRASDLLDRELLHWKLSLLSERMRERFDGEILETVGGAMTRLLHCSDELRIIRPVDLGDIVVAEGAQGILLDQFIGQLPHNTWSDVTPEPALDILEPLGFDVTVIGCMRPYMTRHGAGPFPTEAKDGTFDGIVDHGNPHNQWQGSMRFGHLDLPAIRTGVERMRHLTKAMVHEVHMSCCDHVRIGALMVYREFGDLELTPMAYLDSIIAKELAPITVQAFGPTSEDRRSLVTAVIG